MPLNDSKHNIEDHNLNGQSLTNETEAAASPFFEPWDLTMRSLDSAITVSHLSIATSASGSSDLHRGSIDENDSSISIIDAHEAGMLGSRIEFGILEQNQILTETVVESGDSEFGSNSREVFNHRLPTIVEPTRNHETQTSVTCEIDHQLGSHSLISNSNFSSHRAISSQPIIPRSNVSYGNTIDENHVNFVLMYDMLTGIRHSVSACQAKPCRPLTDHDFRYNRTYNFVDDCLDTSPSRYEFRFKDYCPWVFRSLREAFHIDAADYLLSLTGKYALSEICSPGKSGSLFYFSQDFRYIIKTIRRSEHEFLRKILRYYYEHIRHNGNSLLTRFYGLHRVRMSKLKKIYFVVMGNIFPPHRDTHETYDLKGSTLGRIITDEEVQESNLITLKDLNWINRGKKLVLGPQKATTLMNQLIADCTFLAKMKIMDYSLLVGIHYTQRGNSDNVRDRSLTVYEPDNCGHNASSEYINSNTHSDESLDGEHCRLENSDQILDLKASKCQNRTTLNSRLGHSVPHFKPSLVSASAAGDIAGVPRERRTCIFYSDDGGFRSSSKDGVPGNEIYFLGIIDILTPYSIGKRFEHFFKSVRHSSRDFSAINPSDYSKRFLKFMSENILQDTSADYSTKPLPRIPMPKYRAAEIRGISKDPYDGIILIEKNESTDDEHMD